MKISLPPDLLSASYEAKNRHISQLFNTESNRVQNFSASFKDFYFDFSKQNISKSDLDLLFLHCESIQLKKKIKAMYEGENVNVTEDRPALHIALRADKAQKLHINGVNVVEAVHEQLEMIDHIASKIRNGLWRGYSGKPITDVISLGVGGSELGPLFVCDALDDISNGEAKNLINLHFVSSMDGTQISKLLSELNKETSLFIISSKSFTTIDTFSNVSTVLNWYKEDYNDEKVIKKCHFIGVSANVDKMDEWGVITENRLSFWDWVGGRFSLWSAIGLPIAIKYGAGVFRELLRGANEADNSFSNSRIENNIPILMALVTYWNSSYLDINANAVLPYDGRLRLLPNYLTQLEMESNGKSVSVNGEILTYKTCPIIWGEFGPNAQHAFYQLLHQGTQQVWCDFIVTKKRYHTSSAKCVHTQSLENQHRLSLANCFAQSNVLAFGDGITGGSETDPHKSYPGNQASSTLLIKELNPFNLGALIAFYEHKTYVLGCLWNINSFDQWGVELGKHISSKILTVINSGSGFQELDQSTKSLIEKVNSPDD